MTAAIPHNFVTTLPVMFVRIRRYERPGWRGYFKRVEYRKTDIGTIPFNTYSRHHAREQATHYTVIESVRTDKGPRQKVVASWLDIPSLKDAVEHYRNQLESAMQDEREFREFIHAEPARLAKGYNCYACLNGHRWFSKRDKVDRLKRKLSSLELAFAVLGDWTDNHATAGA